VEHARASAHPLDAVAYAELFRKSSPPQPRRTTIDETVAADYHA
jgi:hypothetical protein